MSLDLILPEPLAASTGLLAMPADQYHQDPAPVPSLSSSIAKLLLEKTPAHARLAHPKLNPDFVEDTERKFDLGTAAHELLLEGETSVCVVEAADWRTKDAKEQADQARAKGLTPLLAKDWVRVEAMANAARRQLGDVLDCDPAPLTNGVPEQSLIWEEDGVWLRARYDWLHDGLAAVDDLKTTAASADPKKWTRTMFGIGADLQAAFYLRGMRKALGVEPEWRFIVQENTPPYALSVVTLSDDLLAHAARRVELAIQIWRQCMADNHWPAYSRSPVTVELPLWMADPAARSVPVGDALGGEDFGEAPPF